MPIFNKDKINGVFDIDNIEEIEHEFKEIKTDVSGRNSEAIIAANIERANRLLDIIENSFERGGGDGEDEKTKPRMMEVAAGLINSVSQAASLCIGFDNALIDLKLKEKTIKLKEMEIVNKAKKIGEGGNGNGPLQGRDIIVTDRETILRMLENEPKQKLKQIENRR